MNVLFTVIAVLVIIASILLTAVVLLQNGKGGGLASNFVAGNQTFGVRQTADILEKITWFLAAFILLLSIASNFAVNTKNNTGVDVTDQIQSEVTEEAPVFPVAAPAADDQE